MTPTQTMLPLPAMVRPAFEPEHQPTIEERFAAFHQANPHVYRELRRIALSAKRAGHRVGIGACFERLRWQYIETSRAADDYKLNNNYRSRYARLLMDTERELAGFFETRELRAA